MAVTAVAVLAMAVMVGGSNDSERGAVPPGHASRTPTQVSRTPSPTVGLDVGSTLCLADQNLIGAHNDHVAPVLADLDDATKRPTAATRTHYVTALKMVLDGGTRLDGLVYPTDPDALVLLRGAYNEYAKGLIALDAAFSSDGSYVWLDTMGPVLDGIAQGKSDVHDADGRLARLEAAGTLDCGTAAVTDAVHGIEVRASTTGSASAQAAPRPTPRPTPTSEVSDSVADATPRPTPGGNPSARVGTRDNPVPLGDSFDVGDWSIKVTNVFSKANRRVADANRFNDPPASGNQYFMVAIRAKYLGSSSANLQPHIAFQAVGDLKVAYDQGFSSGCGVMPEPNLQLSDPEVFEGGVVSGNAACWEIDKADAGSLVMIYHPPYDFDSSKRVWFLLH